MGSKSRRKQAAAMRAQTRLTREQFEYYKEQQGIAKEELEEQKAQFEAFDLTNPFSDVENPYADLQTNFTNLAQGAENAYADLTNQYEGLENMYEGMENRYEDMTIDMRAAEFQVQQGAQQRANILQGLRGAAGGSGIAGLAQALASQGQLHSQQIAAGIGQQERQNQLLATQEGSRIDQLQRGAGMQLQQMEAAGAQQLQSQQAAGAMQVQAMQIAGAGEARQLGINRENQIAQGDWQADIIRRQGEAALQAAEFGRESTLLGMDYGQLAGANQSLSQAMGNQMSAMGMQAQMHGSNAAASSSIWGSAIGAVGTIAGMAIMFSDKRLKKNINLIGTSPNGINIYSFEYKDSKYGKGLFQGVMSDDIPQEAVVNNGEYDMVNYSMLDVEFKQI